MLRKKTSGVARGPSHHLSGKAVETVVDRRTFLRGSGIAVGGLAAAATLVGPSVKPGTCRAVPVAAQIRKSVCTHCSVGCTVVAEVQNGVWTGQEPGWEAQSTWSTLRQKRFSSQTASGERRLKYPMKLVGVNGLV